MNSHLVLFDIDGTLIRRAGPHHKQALVAAIREVTGLIATLDGVDTTGMLDGELLAGMLVTCEYQATDAELGNIVQAAQRYYLAHCPADLRNAVCPGVVEMLSALADKAVPMALVTGNLSAIAWKKMELAGLRGFFSAGAFAEDATTRTELARIAVERTIGGNVMTSRPQVVLVGDHLNDIQAAQANGWGTVAVGTGILPLEQLERSQPDLLVSDLDQLSARDLLAVARPGNP